MSKISENISALEKRINAPVFQKDAALKILSDLKENFKELDKKIEDLENPFDYDYAGPLSAIDCGFGQINYKTGSLPLQDLMENLDAAIQKSNPKKVNEYLNSFY